jgi:quercetin dioxygenase-like cupin family protein
MFNQRFVGLLAVCVLLTPALGEAQGNPSYARSTAGTRIFRNGVFELKVLLEAANFGDGQLEIGELTLPPSPNAALHQHAASEILYVLSGEMDHIVNDTAYALKPGMMGVVRPSDRVAHRVKGTQPARILVIWLPGGEVDRFAKSPAFTQTVIK